MRPGELGEVYNVRTNVLLLLSTGGLIEAQTRVKDFRILRTSGVRLLEMLKLKNKEAEKF